MDKVITIDDIYKTLDFVADDCQNPISDNGECVYTCGYAEYSHCIAGDIISKLGFELPDPDDYDNSVPVEQLIKNRYDNQFDDDAIEMLTIGQVTADRLTHNDDPIAWSWAKRDMVNFFLKARKEEIAQRNLQAGH